MVAFDCGAHIGEYSLLFSQLVGCGGQVHAFEPDPRVYAYLEENVVQNELSNVVLNREGLNSREDSAPYRLQPDATTSSLSQYAESDGMEEIVIRTTTLDNYARLRQLHRVDALKIDVEGAEADVLAGARDVLLRLRPGLVFVECDRHKNTAAVTEALEATGYRVAQRFDPGHLHPHVIARKGASRRHASEAVA